MNRRLLLAGTAALAACSTSATVPVTSLQTALTDVQTITSGITSAIALLTADATLQIPAATQAAIASALADVQGAAASIATSISVSAATTVSYVQAFATSLNSVIAYAVTIPAIPVPYSLALQAATVLLPIVEAEVGLTAARLPAVAAVKPGLTPDAARAYLKGLAAVRP